MRRSASRALLAAVATAGMLVAMSALATPAIAAVQAPWWRLSSSSAPTNLRPGDKEAVISAVASNIGDGEASGIRAPITIADSLPAGLTAKSIKLMGAVEHEELACEPLPALSCTYHSDVQPYERLEVRIIVEVAEDMPIGQIENQLRIEGGEAPSASISRPLNVADEVTGFGAQSVELTPEREDGTADAQAGSHPFQLTTTFDFNRGLEAVEGELRPSSPALLKNLHFDLPPGLIGDPQATPQCSNLDFSTLLTKDENPCPSDTVVGAALVTVNEPLHFGFATETVPVFNLTPAPGEPARFGFEVFNVPVVLDTSVRTGGDYSVQVNVSDASQTAQVLGTQVTLWGEPGDPRHDQSRGWACILGGRDALEGESCEAPEPRPVTPFLTLPTSCEGPLVATLTGSSWSGGLLEGAASIPALEGCGELPFTPSIEVKSETQTASTPTGLSVGVKVPQKALLEDGALAQADVRDTTVALPQGVQLNPSAANGLQACSETQIGFTGFNSEKQINEFTPSPAACPDASKVGLVHIRTPLLPHELEGSVYLAAQNANPFSSLLALYVVAEEPVSRVLVKLAGEVSLNESTLQATTTFKNTPQVPFEELKLDLFGGPRASLSTPAACGAYGTEALFTPWSGTAPVDVSSSPGELEVTSAADGGACPGSPRPFSPAFDAQSANATAGAFTPFSLEITRPDGDQALQGVSMHLPDGVSGMLSSVALCREPQASKGECGAESEVGQAIESAGLGPDPYRVTGGKVYITGPYGGAPFGLSIVTPAVAGPFNLGSVVVRSRIYVNPETAALSIVSDPLPTQLKGIPLQLKQVEVRIDRPNFQFNPTSCDPMKITGTLTGAQGASDGVSSPFQVAGCQSLPFAPRLSAVAGGRGSKADGTSLDVKVESGGVGAGGVVQAGIAKVDLQLPVALSSRLSTLQKACPEAVFEANPASCSEGSVIGFATIHTPVLSKPLSGPAYLVSHGGAAFPDVEFVLQGEGITLVLDGKTDIKAGVTYSRFESAPDAPFTVFETVLPAGPHGVLTANVPERQDYSLCKASLVMPTEITGQNGVVIKQDTNIAVTGCARVKDSRTAKPTRAQLLARALRACKKYDKKARRAACERKALKRYAAKASKRRVGLRPR